MPIEDLKKGTLVIKFLFFVLRQNDNGSLEKLEGNGSNGLSDGVPGRH